MLPSRTYEVQSGYALGLVESQAIVTWALDAIVAGFDSKSLRILAGLDGPLDQEEIRRLYSAAFAELGIRPLPEAAHVRFYVTSVLRAMLSGTFGRKEALERLSDLHISRGYDRELTDFYLLYHAKWDLESSEVQWYWEDANRSNIDRIIEEHARNWLSNHASEEAA